MPEITISQDQYQQLQELRSEVEAVFVDTYGHTRIEDVIEYLLDSCPPPDEQADHRARRRIEAAEYAQLQRIASDVPGVAGSGIGAEEMREQLLEQLSTAELLSRLEPVDGDNHETTEDEQLAEPDDTQPLASEDTEGSDSSRDRKSDSTESLPGSINTLLEDNADKWREGDGDAPYEVDLPDGSSTSARTKDDVRQLLFKHYQ